MYKNILNNLYNRSIKGNQSSLECKFKEYADTFDISIKNLWDKLPDCQVGHFGYNFYFRTPYGIKQKKYKNIYTLFKAIKIIGKTHNLTLQSIGIKKDYKYKALLTI